VYPVVFPILVVSLFRLFWNWVDSIDCVYCYGYFVGATGGGCL